MVHLLFILLVYFSNGEKYLGTVNQNSQGIGFLGKFCYDKNHDTSNTKKSVGNLTITLFSKIDVSGLDVMLFSDEDDSWPMVYENKDISCESIKLKARNIDEKTGDIVNSYKPSWTKVPDGYVWKNQPAPITQNVRPRWWYVAIGACYNDFSQIGYQMHMYQMQHSSWNKEFGVNEMGLNTLYLAFFFYYVILIAVHSVGTYKLRMRLEFTHPLVRLFFIILLLQFLVVILRMLHYGIFANNGWGVPEMKQFAEVVEVFVRILFVILLMLLAKGWTINNEQLQGRKLLLLFASAFLIVETLVVIWKYAVVNPAATDLPLGLRIFLIMINIIWFIWCFWFVHTLFRSYKEEENPPKKKLYALIGLIYYPWFFGLPFITVLQFALDPWVREKFVDMFSIIISTIGYSFLAFLLWPSRAEEYFAITSPDPMNQGIPNYNKL